MLLAFLFCSIAVDRFAVIVKYLVVVRVLYLDVHEKFVSGVRASRGPLFAV